MTWLSLALAVICVAAFIISPRIDSTASAREFHPNQSMRGSYAYIDVVEVSDWIYNIDNGKEVYYTVRDVDNYMYTVRLSKSQFAAMSAQYAYFNRAEGDPMSEPAPYRLYGVVRKPSSEVVDAVILYWRIDSTEEYNMYFGKTYLDATSTPGSNAQAFLFIVAIVGLGIWLGLLKTVTAPAKAYKKCAAELMQSGELDNAAIEFTDPANVILEKDKARLSGRFIFGKNTGIAVRYDDITWCYKHTLTYNGSTSSSLIINTRTIKKHQLFVIPNYDVNGMIQYVMEVISQRNPNALIGYTAENIQASKNM